MIQRKILVLLMLGLFLNGCSQLNTDFLADYDKNLIGDIFDESSGGVSKNEAMTVIENKKVDVDGNLTIHFISVGQGDSILIELPGKQFLLVDTGLAESADEIWRVLEDNNAVKLDYLILTHPHADHIEATEALIEKGLDFDKYLESGYACNTLTCRKTKDAVEKVNPEIIDFELEQDLNLNIPVRILHPDRKNRLESSNNNSVVLLVQFNEVSILLTGDCEKECETEITERFGGIQSEILKAGHHGSSTSSSEEFLQAVTPETVVISAGERNKYGHPHETSLKKYAGLNAVVFRTDLHGTITVTTNGVDYSILTEKPA